MSTIRLATIAEDGGEGRDVTISAPDLPIGPPTWLLALALTKLVADYATGLDAPKPQPSHPGEATPFDGKAALEHEIIGLRRRLDAEEKRGDILEAEVDDLAEENQTASQRRQGTIEKLTAERDEARAKVAELEAQVARLSAFGETVHRVRAALEEPQTAGWVTVVGEDGVESRSRSVTGGVFTGKGNPDGVMGTGGGA
jgi:hypothetical protein